MGEIDLINPSVSSCRPPVFALIEWLPVLSRALLERWGAEVARQKGS